MMDKQLPVLFHSSRYAQRLPIGKKELIETFPRETLTRFYRDWYRPDLMALIAVGDFNPAWIVDLIRAEFNLIPLSHEVRQRPVFPVPDHDELLIGIATDPEASSSSVSLHFKHPLRSEIAVSDYRRSIVEICAGNILTDRLGELVRKADPPFLYAYADDDRLVRSCGIFSLTAGVEEGGVLRGLEALVAEAERVRQHGFTSTELERTKTDILRTMEVANNERDKTESAAFASELVRHVVWDEPVPGIDAEYDMVRSLLPTIQLNEVNSVINDWMTEANRVVLVSAPEDAETVPSEEIIRSAIERIAGTILDPYNDAVSDAALVPDPPLPSHVVSESYIDTLGITEWILENGVRVVLKPTDFQNDQILFTAYSPGGTSLIPDSLFVPAATATSIIAEGGAGPFTSVELNKKLAGMVASVSPYIGQLTEGISGSCSPQDVETLFQLIWLKWTSPRRDSSAYLSVKTRLKGFIENRDARPESAFQDTLDVTLAQRHPRVAPWTLERLERMNLDASIRIFTDRFSDASDFTFFFVGNFTPDSLRPPVEQYLGGLPSTTRQETWRDLGIRHPKGVIQKDVRKGMEPKSRVALVMTGDCAWTPLASYQLASAAEVLENRLRDVLREDLSGTYGVSVGASMSRIPRETYSIHIGFGCAPDRTEELIRSVFDQIDSLKTIGSTLSDVQNIQEADLRAYETNLKENRFWLNALQAAYFNEQDPLRILRYREQVETLSPDVIREMMRTYFSAENLVRVVLYPDDGNK